MVHIRTLLIGIWFTTSSIALPAPSSLAIRTTPGVPDFQQLLHTHQILYLDWEYWVESLECAGFTDKDGVLIDPTTRLPLREHEPNFSAYDMYLGELCRMKKKDPSQSTAGWEDEWKKHSDGGKLHQIYQDYATRFREEWKTRHAPSQARPVDTHKISGTSSAAALIKTAPPYSYPAILEKLQECGRVNKAGTGVKKIRSSKVFRHQIPCFEGVDIFHAYYAKLATSERKKSWCRVQSALETDGWESLATQFNKDWKTTHPGAEHLQYP
ncbi:hypothetical protein L208DRAFT_1463065 [Tricholoma matsutake]|nr:hypothetical protein L208DRAFT_1463065 [Tricholoma matsutake 945]